MKKVGLAIFNRFKTGKMELTGEAKRQRNIIMTLAKHRANPADRTRTSIAQQIAKTESTLWKNIYSGIFRDLDEVLLPMQIVTEEGRLPLKRGPKALQEIGVPYYRLTREGVLVAAALAGSKERTELLDVFFAKAESQEETRFADILCVLSESSPFFVFHIIQLYVDAFCKEKIDSLLPFDLTRLQTISDNSLLIQREIITAFAKFSKQERDDIVHMLNEAIGGDAHQAEKYEYKVETDDKGDDAKNTN